MGVSCCGESKRDKLKNLQSLLSEEIKEKEKEIREVQGYLLLIEIEIKKSEKNIKNFPNDYESNKLQKIQTLKNYLYDKERFKLKLKYLEAYNQILKENLNNIEIKIMKLKNKEHLKKINNIIDDVGDVSTKEELENNINLLLKEKQIDNEEIRLLENGHKVLNSEISKEIDNYINNLFST